MQSSPSSSTRVFSTTPQSNPSSSAAIPASSASGFFLWHVRRKLFPRDVRHDDGRLNPRYDFALCLRRRHRQHRKEPYHVGACQRQNRKRSPAPALQSGLHVSSRFHPTPPWNQVEDSELS